MRVSYRWLRELLPTLDREPTEVAELLSGVGLAVDAISLLGDALRSVIIAEVKSFAPHPERSSLRLPLRDYVRLKLPGRYRARLFFHNEVAIASRASLEGLIVSSADEITIVLERR